MNKLILYSIIATLILIALIILYNTRKKEKSKILILSFIYSILLETAIMPLRGYVNFQTSLLVGFFMFFALTYYLASKYSDRVNPTYIFLILLLGIFLLLAPPHFFFFKKTLVSLPDVFFRFIGIIAGYLFFNLKTKKRWLVFVVTSVICFFMFARGYDMWLNKLNFGTFTETLTEEEIPNDFLLTDSLGSEIKINDLQGKVVILDFWNSRCGVCFSKFPQVQSTYDKYKQNPDIFFCSVNYFLEDDKDGDAFRIIKEQGYSFPVLICKDKLLLKNLGIQVYPTVIVINKEGKLIFRGNIETADKSIGEILSKAM